MDMVITKRSRGGKRHTTVIAKFQNVMDAALWLHHWLEMLGESLGGINHTDKPTIGDMKNMGFAFVKWETCPENK
jgi:hypothetical protein